MSRWVLALVGVGFALTPLRAQPRPLWEIEPFTKGWHPVWWLDFAPDGKTFAAQVVERDDIKAETVTLTSTCRLLAWDVATRKEILNHKLGSCANGNGFMRANATTKVGSCLVAGSSPAEVRVADGASAIAKNLQTWPYGVWLNRDNSDSLWLMDIGLSDYYLAFGKMPLLAPDPKAGAIREQWLKTKLPGDWGDGSCPVVAVNADLTRLALYSRSGRKFTLYNIAVDDKLKLTEVATAPAAHEGRIGTLRFSPDGKTFATGSEEASVGLWDVEKAGKHWKPRATIATGKFPVAAFAFSPDGGTLAVGTFEQKGRSNLFLIDAPAGQLLASHRLDGALISVAYSPDGKMLVTGNHLGRVQAWDAGALRNP